MKINRKFFERNTLEVAKDLLGCFLVRKIGSKIIYARITETEAYMGEDDLASHASKGRTPRTELMFGEAGRLYVYMIYGMYFCLNIITEKKNFPAAILIRGVEIENIDRKKTNGPGKICKILKIDRKLNGWDIVKGEKIWIASPRLVRLGRKKEKLNIKKAKRIGIDYAKHCRHYLWRFYINA